MKYFVLIVFFKINLLLGLTTDSTFKLMFNSAGLGFNMGSMQPTIVIENKVLTYTYEQNSYYTKRTIKTDTVCIIPFRQTAIDSIKYLIKNLDDTSVFLSDNFGSIQFVYNMTILRGEDSIKFTGHDNCSKWVINCIEIINAHLSSDQQIWVFGMPYESIEVKLYEKKRRKE